jgi:hypothetical protein
MIGGRARVDCLDQVERRFGVEDLRFADVLERKPDLLAIRCGRDIWAEGTLLPAGSGRESIPQPLIVRRWRLNAMSSRQDSHRRLPERNSCRCPTIAVREACCWDLRQTTLRMRNRGLLRQIF